jgi:hypothetical protein
MDKRPNRGGVSIASRDMANQPPGPGEAPESIVQQLRGVVIRVPTLLPMSRQQLAVAALLSEGWRPNAVAEMMGIGHQTVNYHANEAADRVPGDLPRSGRLIAWYRGAPLSVLSRPGALDPPDLPDHLQRRGAIRRALTIVEGRGCPCCGYDGVIESAKTAHNMTAGAERALADELGAKL